MGNFCCVQVMPMSDSANEKFLEEFLIIIFEFFQKNYYYVMGLSYYYKPRQ